MAKVKNSSIVIEKALLKSKAYKTLKKPAAFFVLGIFWTKRQMSKSNVGKHKGWIIKNNGEIEFTYPEAETEYEIPASTFRNALIELIDKGFIDIAASGQGIYKAKNLYSLSNRWRKYDTPDYEQPQSRPKSVNRGFQKGNQYGRNCLKEKKLLLRNNIAQLLRGNIALI